MTDLPALRQLMERATKGPWETDTYMPSHEEEVSIQIIGPTGLLLFESSNCGTRCIGYELDEDGATYFDEGSRPNFDLVVALRNAAPQLLAAAADAERYKKALEEIGNTNIPEQSAGHVAIRDCAASMQVTANLALHPYTKEQP